MSNDLTTPHPSIKYVDDMIVFAVSKTLQKYPTQNAMDPARHWSHKNSMNINPSKTKNMIIFFSGVDNNVPHIVVGSVETERVTSSTFLGAELSDKLARQMSSS